MIDRVGDLRGEIVANFPRSMPCHNCGRVTWTAGLFDRIIAVWIAAAARKMFSRRACPPRLAAFPHGGQGRRLNNFTSTSSIKLLPVASPALGWQLHCHPRGDSTTVAPTTGGDFVDNVPA